jgi:plastocyanin
MHSCSLTDVVRRSRSPVVIAAAAFLIGGCGGGGQVAGPATTSGAAAAAGVVLNLTGTEYSFSPPTLNATAGKTTIRFTNKGVVEHDFTIDALHVKLAAKPGKSAQATVTLTPGTYPFYCTVPGHLQSGMRGKLAVS